MAHEISFQKNEIGDAFFVGESAWHRHGTVLTEAPSLQEAMQLGGLDFEVALRKIATEAGEGDWVEMPDYFATYRTDSGTRFGIVGNRYHALQNSDAFGVLQPLLDNNLVSLETGGTLRDGADVWMMVKFNILDERVAEFFAEEGIIPFGLITNNHSGRSQVKLMFTPVRVVCANTLGMATNGIFSGLKRTESIVQDAAGKVSAVRVRHTLSVKSATVEAASALFGQVAAGFGEIMAQYQVLKAAKLDEELFEKIVLRTAAPMPTFKGIEPTTRQKASIEAVTAKRRELKRLWTEGKGHTGDLSAYEAYNGVVEAVDHNRELFGVRGGELESLYDGGLAGVKQKTLDELLKYAAKVA